MSDSLSIGWTQAESRARLRTFKRVYAFNLALQAFIAAAALFVPSVGAFFTGIEDPTFWPYIGIWGATVIQVSALQVPALLDPIRHRFIVFIAIGIRFFMGTVFIVLPADFWRMAAYDLAFGVILAVLFHRVLIAELQTRP